MNFSKKYLLSTFFVVFSSYFGSISLQAAGKMPVNQKPVRVSMCTKIMKALKPYAIQLGITAGIIGGWLWYISDLKAMVADSNPSDAAIVPATIMALAATAGCSVALLVTWCINCEQQTIQKHQGNGSTCSHCGHHNHNAS